jgi:hypothetical protein
VTDADKAVAILAIAPVASAALLGAARLLPAPAGPLLFDVAGIGFIVSVTMAGTVALMVALGALTARWTAGDAHPDRDSTSDRQATSRAHG